MTGAEFIPKPVKNISLHNSEQIVQLLNLWTAYLRNPKFAKNLLRLIPFPFRWSFLKPNFFVRTGSTIAPTQHRNLARCLSAVLLAVAEALHLAEGVALRPVEVSCAATKLVLYS